MKRGHVPGWKGVGVVAASAAQGQHWARKQVGGGGGKSQGLWRGYVPVASLCAIDYPGDGRKRGAKGRHGANAWEGKDGVGVRRTGGRHAKCRVGPGGGCIWVRNWPCSSSWKG